MRFESFLLSACVMLASMGASAQTLVSGAGVKVETEELRLDLGFAPADVRQNLATPETLRANVSNIFVRRVLAKEALAAGVDQNPLVANAILKAKERILSDAMLEKIDQSHQPSLQVIEAYAASVYKNNPQKFPQEEEVKVRHILLRIEEPDAKVKTEALLKELQAGADFAKLAETRSQDPGSAAKGGDLGWISRGRTVKPFEDAAMALDSPGQLSGVVASPFGFHIIKLDSKKQAGFKPFEEVKDGLMQEAQKTLLNDGRYKERDRILNGAKFEMHAIETLSKELLKP